MNTFAFCFSIQSRQNSALAEADSMVSLACGFQWTSSSYHFLKKSKYTWVSGSQAHYDTRGKYMYRRFGNIARKLEKSISASNVYD